MTEYRIYFVSMERMICGRHDFDADNDQSAIQIARVLFAATQIERTVKKPGIAYVVLRYGQGNALSRVCGEQLRYR